MADLADISEHQSGVPGGHDGYIIRTVSDGGREDFMWRQHHAGAAGRPRGAYCIIKPSISGDTYADLFLGTLRAVPWEIVPTVDIEIGDPWGAHAVAERLRDRLHAAGYPVVMGYYSRDSAYRQVSQGLFQRQWIAAYSGSPYPPGADMHQYTSTPYDKNYTPDLGRLLLAAAPPPPQQRRVFEDSLLS